MIIPKPSAVAGECAEMYHLLARGGSIEVKADQPAGRFYGQRTADQLRAAGPVPDLSIEDSPRFGWRGLMLDVARHFFDVGTVKHVIDLMAAYKLNVLHLHLTDDQGWRIEIDSWPKLTAVGGATQVGGGRGGFYTKADYAEIVGYAAERFITVVPEVDVPGHTNAALASYPELTADGAPVAPYTGTDVGFSALVPGKPGNERFFADVFGEIAEMTPGPYLHIGGDEAHTLSEADYIAAVTRIHEIVARTGKRVIGWQETAVAELPTGSIVQYWNPHESPDAVRRAAAAGNQVIMSPAGHTYLDMKYDAGTELGQDWAGHVSVQDAYDWDPASVVEGVDERHILGVEAALWTETVDTRADIEHLLLPRLAAVAEVAWSSGAKDWDEFRARLAVHAGSWADQGLNFRSEPHL
ncbi:MAG TPA: family 20 glycosylhydrolase [Jiangellaceae bacterium]